MSTSPDTIEAEKQAREALLNAWACSSLKELGASPAEDFKIRPASDDASFRRYFRGEVSGQTYIFVDAPPDKENSEPFVRIASMLAGKGVHAPHVFKYDLGQGFMMLSDLGNELYFGALATGDKEQVQQLYSDAFEAIARMQQIVPEQPLPGYNESLLVTEMSLFTEWFLPKQLGVATDASTDQVIQSVYAALVQNAISQPVVFVHRDFHCRNLMVVENNNPGVIDFQDAVMGPVTYDLVSLLKDCYHRFNPDDIESWVEMYRRRLVENGLVDISAEQFMRWFDLMGMQRHLKCAGIFSRLNLRDGKPRYLADIPLVVEYIVETATRYPEFASFADWLRGEVVPVLENLRQNS